MRISSIVIAAGSLAVVSLGSVQSARSESLPTVREDSVSIMLAQTRVRDAQGQSKDSDKLDLNNATPRQFRSFRGMFPTLARVITENAPYSDVADVLEIPGLSPRQIETLESHLDSFTVTPPSSELVEEDGRINTGSYD